VVPGTAAAALRGAGRWQLGQPLDADASDWWYHTSFGRPDAEGRLCTLCLDGLATLAEVWLNGECLLKTANMFRAYRVDVRPHLRPHNDLLIAFRSLDEDLKRKRPRPRWKTDLVAHQQLRWRRTTLLGRIPGWSPPVAPVGPWRPVRLETGPAALPELRLHAALEDGAGVVTLHARAESARPIDRAVLRVGGRAQEIDAVPAGGGWQLRTSLRLEDAPVWNPHTHGEPALVGWSLDVECAGERLTTGGRLGFRRVEVHQDGGFRVEVNGAPVYCRGACWTVGDPVGLGEETLGHDLRLARDAGANVLRVGGTMLYESDRFYELCDELGLLVWQDFAFANMDYPAEDADFAAEVRAEAEFQLARLARHPCVAVYCGNSEVEQQAALRGAPRELWRNAWFAEHLPALVAQRHPGTGYVASSPSGGVLPFHVSVGVSHYYGVGAYLRPPGELRQANVGFAAECLAFANVPEPETTSLITGGGPPVWTAPRWKQRVPRDAGAGWDFEDVRDHYLRTLFGVDPVRLRCFDPSRYLQLSRVVPGEMMAQVFSEWRGGPGRNRGGLVWFWKDLWPAAGWGVVDGRGDPKAGYYYLRRAWARRQLVLTDEGLDGLHLHVLNETAAAFRCRVELVLLRDQRVVVARAEAACELPPWSRQTLSADGLLGAFHDVTYAYRFGPPGHDAAVATLLDDQRQVVGEAFYFVERREPALLGGINLQAAARRAAGGAWEVRLRCDRLLQGVRFDAPGFLPDDNYFHLAPARDKVVTFTPRGGEPAAFKCHLESLNLRDAVKVACDPPAPGGPDA
jgi:beta-mannosidase